MDMQNINEQFQSLPYYLKREVLDYFEFLRKQHKVENKKKRFTFNWEGGLKEIKENYSAVDLRTIQIRF